MTDGWGISCKIALRWMPLDLTDDKSTLIQVMAWCHQATSHYLSQCWPRFMSPYGVTRPQWVEVSVILNLMFTCSYILEFMHRQAIALWLECSRFPNFICYKHKRKYLKNIFSHLKCLQNMLSFLVLLSWRVLRVARIVLRINKNIKW